MESSRGHNLQLATVGAIVLLVAAAAYFFLGSEQATEQIPELDAGPDVSTQVSGAVESPGDKLPGTNPFSDYKNPFE